MSIKIHLVFSLLIHSLILMYFLSLPIYKSGVDVTLFEEYFVYLRSDEGKDSGKPSTTEKIKKSDLGKKKVSVSERKEILEGLKVESLPEEGSSSENQVVEIIKKGVSEHEVFSMQEASKQMVLDTGEGKEIVEPLEEKKPETDVSENLLQEKPTEDTIEPLKEGVVVYEGTVLKTTPGFTVIPYEEASRVEILHAKREEITDKKERDGTEVIATQKEPSMKEFEEEEKQVKVQAQVQKEKEIEAQGKVEVEEQIKSAKHIEQEKKTEIDTDTYTVTVIKIGELKGTFETDVSKLAYLQEETEPTTPAEVDVGLLLETMPGDMKKPFKDELTTETLNAEEEVLKIEKEAIDKEGHYEEEKELFQEFVNNELPFDRSRVEEKLKYIEYSISQSSSENNLVEKEGEEETVNQIGFPDVLEVETGLLLASVPGRTMVPIEEELRSALNTKGSEKIDKKLKKGDFYHERPLAKKEQEVNIADFESYPSEMEKVKRESDIELKELAQVISPQDIEYNAEEIPSESLVEKVIDTPLQIKTEKLGESYKDDFKEGETEIQESAHAEDVLSTGKERLISREEYLLTNEEKKEQVSAEVKPLIKEDKGFEEKKHGLGLFLPNVFLKKDIKIEFSMIATRSAEVSFQLTKKSHPLDEKDGSMNKKEIELVEDRDIEYTESYKRVFSITRAEKGIYIFMIKNSGSKGYEANISFHIFEGKSGERKKEYKTIELLPESELKYKFIIPEAIFWDDEDYFTGTIESANTMTKFNEKTGLIWKEEKDY